METAQDPPWRPQPRQPRVGLSSMMGDAPGTVRGGSSSCISGFHLSLHAKAEGWRLSHGEVASPSPPQPWSSPSCPFPKEGGRGWDAESLPPAPLWLAAGPASHGAEGAEGFPPGAAVCMGLGVLIPSGTLGQATLQTRCRGRSRGGSERLGTALSEQMRAAELVASGVFGRSQESPSLPQPAV